MPGMASREEMAALSDARGPEFDRQWATLMHAHHRGGLPMTEAVLAETGARQRARAGRRHARQPGLRAHAAGGDRRARRGPGRRDDDEHGEHSYH
jgi:hypothetical protein